MAVNVLGVLWCAREAGRGMSTNLGMAERLDEVAPTLPIGRVGAPEEIVAAILRLLSEAASYTTGTTLRVAGGR